MADNEKQSLEEGIPYTLTKNVINRNKILGFNKRNWGEAILYTTIVACIVFAIPFTDIVTIMSLVVLVPLVFFVNLYGIKHRSLSEIIIAEMNFRSNRRRLHLRSPEYVRKKSKTTYTESEDESLAEQHFKLVKQGLNEFIEKYASEEDSQIS